MGCPSVLLLKTSWRTATPLVPEAALPNAGAPATSFSPRMITEMSSKNERMSMRFMTMARVGMDELYAGSKKELSHPEETFIGDESWIWRGKMNIL